jgi:hypothetical protein
MKLTLEIRDEDAELIREFLELTKDLDANRCSHGPLTMKLLARMLLEDVALAVRRPGSWEGANMLSVLRAHGYLR